MSVASDQLRRILVLDHQLEMTGEQMTRLREAGAEGVQTFVHWRGVEPEPGVYDWDQVDRFVQSADRAGMHVLLRVPAGSPDWAPREWYFRSHYATNADSEQHNRFFSPWKEEATRYTEEFIRLACSRYDQTRVTCCSCIGWAGETWFPVFMGNDHYLTEGHPRALWCFDAAAQADFRQRMARKYKRVESFNRANGTEFASWKAVEPGDLNDDLLRWADTIEWYNQSAERYFTRIMGTFLAARGPGELWMATVPRHGFFPHQIDAGMFQAEEWIERLGRKLGRRGGQLNVLWYSIFLTDPLSLAFHYWLLRHYDLRVWVGAEGVANIVENSRRAQAAGCLGVVIGNPFAGNFATLPQNEAMVRIGEAAEIWRQ